MKKITVMIDGGHLRTYVKKAGKPFTADYIEKIGLACSLATEEIVRILYYDCAPFSGKTHLPVSGTEVTHTAAAPLLNELGLKDLFAVTGPPRRNPGRAGHPSQLQADAGTPHPRRFQARHRLAIMLSSLQR